MFQINLYRQASVWMFDDTTRSIKAEPFVCGASEMIQKYLDRKGDGRIKDVLIEFSLEPLNNADIILTYIKKHKPLKLVQLQDNFGEFMSNHLSNVSYIEDDNAKPTSADYTDQEGDVCWLCPAQLKFFGKVADTIYARFI